jgi:hypothetical protein
MIYAEVKGGFRLEDAMLRIGLNFLRIRLSNTCKKVSLHPAYKTGSMMK